MLSLELLLYEIIAFLFLSLTISFGTCLFVRNLSSLILLNICTFGRSCFLCSGSLLCLPWWFLWIIHKCVFNKCTTKVCVISRWCFWHVKVLVICSPSRQIRDFVLVRFQQIQSSEGTYFKVMNFRSTNSNEDNSPGWRVNFKVHSQCTFLPQAQTKPHV